MGGVCLDPCRESWQRGGPLGLPFSNSTKKNKGVFGMIVMVHQLESLPFQMLLNHL